MTTEEKKALAATDGEQATWWLTDAPVWKAIAHMAVPMVLGMIAMSIYNFTDMLFVGMLDDTAALAAITLCTPVLSLMIAASTFLEVGLGSFLARAVGAGDLAASKNASAFGCVGAVVLGLLIAVGVLCFLDPLLGLLGATGEAAQPTRQFLTVFCLGAPFGILNMVAGQMVRAIAKSKEASAGIIASSVINIVLDPVLIFGCGLGIQGAALATVVSNAAAACYFLFVIARSDVLSCNPAHARLPLSQVADIAKVGFSGMIMGLLMGVASLVFNNVAMAYGAAVVAAFGIAQSVVQLLEVVTMGLYEGVVPLMGGAWGAGNRARLKEVAGKTFVCIAVFCTVSGAAVIAASSTIVGAFSDDVQVHEVGSLILVAQTLAVGFASTSGLVTGMFQACGKGLPASVLATLRGFAFVPIILGGSLLFGLAGVIWGLLAAEVVAFAVAVVLLTVTFGRTARTNAPA